MSPTLIHLTKTDKISQLKWLFAYVGVCNQSKNR